MKIKELLKKYIQDPLNDKICYNLGVEYYNIGHTASALSYFMRCAEITNDNELSYVCLLYSANCLNLQGKRKEASKGLILHAMDLIPERPEAHHMYARILEVNKQWQECYTTCTLAMNFCNFDLKPLFNIEYFEKTGFIFEKAVSGWWIGRCDEARELFSDLYYNLEMPDWMNKVVKENMLFLNLPIYLHTHYDKSKYSKLKVKFKDSEKIRKNYSQAYQDMFVLSALNGKKRGWYLEIGSGDPFVGSNTALLERNFDWNGVSIEMNKELTKKFSEERDNKVITQNATTIDYDLLLKNSNDKKEWDYLQIDCDPPNISYQVLKMIPLDKYKFAVITYEHDYYADEKKIYRDLSREYLKNKGYVMIVNDIAPDKKSTFEDWWIHPKLISKETIEKLKFVNNGVNKAEDYMLK